MRRSPTVKILYPKKDYFGKWNFGDHEPPTAGELANEFVVMNIHKIVDTEMTDIEICDFMYRRLNDDETVDIFIKQDDVVKYGVYHTSMSTGDICEIDGVKYQCENLGWRKV